MSVHGDLFEWALGQLESSGVVASSSVKLRNRPVWFQTDPDPMIVISPGMEGETLVSRQTGNVLTFAFSILVTYIGQTSQQYASPAALADARAAIRNAVLRLKPIDAVRLGLYDPKPTIDLLGFPEGFTVSPQLFVYHGNETILE